MKTVDLINNMLIPGYQDNQFTPNGDCCHKQYFIYWFDKTQRKELKIKFSSCKIKVYRSQPNIIYIYLYYVSKAKIVNFRVDLSALPYKI